MRHRWAVTVAALSSLLSTACSSPTQHPQSPASPTTLTPVMTLTRYDVGEHFTLTAAVHRVLGTHATVVRAVDLPPEGLLILGAHPADLDEHHLISASGVVRLFLYAEFADAYDLTDPTNYSAFDGDKFLLAGHIRSWA